MHTAAVGGTEHLFAVASYNVIAMCGAVRHPRRAKKTAPRICFMCRFNTRLITEPERFSKSS